MARKTMPETQGDKENKASNAQADQATTEKDQAAGRYFQPRDRQSGQVYQDWALI